MRIGELYIARSLSAHARFPLLTRFDHHQLVNKDHEILKLKEEEARRIVSLEDRLMQTMRAEIAKASPSKHGAGI